MSAPSEAISISSNSPEEDASVDGTERSIASVHQTPAASADTVLPSIEEAPESDKIDNQVMEWVLQKRPDLTRGEVLFFVLPPPVRLRIYQYHEIHHRSAYPVSGDGQCKAKHAARLRISLSLMQSHHDVQYRTDRSLGHLVVKRRATLY